MKQIKLVYRYGGRKLKEFISDGLYFLCEITGGHLLGAKGDNKVGS